MGIRGHATSTSMPRQYSDSPEIVGASDAKNSRNRELYASVDVEMQRRNNYAERYENYMKE